MIEATRAGTHADAVARLAQPVIDGEWASGLAIGLVDGNSVETYGFGRIGDSDSARPNEDTVFEIGSISKVFTALVLADSTVRGDVRLDQPVNELLPAGASLASPDGQAVTLKHLATHSSGLPALPPNLTPTSLDDPYAQYTPALLYQSLTSTPLASTPGTKYAYSNFGAGLLGQVLADREGTTYGALLAQRITEPLGMNRTGRGLPADNVASGHDADGAPVAYWEFDALAGAGAIRSSVSDMIRFARANLVRSNDALGRALALAQEVHADLPGSRVGLGWHIGHGGPLDGIRWHNGQTGGFHSFMAIDPGGQKAAILLANTASVRLDELGVALLRALRGETVSLNLPPTIAVSESVLGSYVGTYRLAPGFDLTVMADGTRLYLQATGQPRYRVFAASETTFFYRVVDAQVEFRKDAAGGVDALILRQGGRDLVASRVPE